MAGVDPDRTAVIPQGVKAGLAVGQSILRRDLERIIIRRGEIEDPFISRGLVDGMVDLFQKIVERHPVVGFRHSAQNYIRRARPERGPQQPDGDLPVPVQHLAGGVGGYQARPGGGPGRREIEPVDREEKEAGPNPPVEVWTALQKGFQLFSQAEKLRERLSLQQFLQRPVPDRRLLTGNRFNDPVYIHFKLAPFGR